MQVILIFLFAFESHAVVELTDDQDIDSELTEIDNASFEEKEFTIEEVSFEKIEGKPIIDGEINDPFWKKAKHFVIDMEFYPTRFAEAIVKTDVWIGLGKDHLYLAFNAHDPAPSQIRSAIKDRDSVKDDDYVSLVIDPTGKLAKKYEFRINPHGVLNDVLQDVISDRYIYDWNTQYSGEAKIYDGGYYAELAIPFDSMKFPEYETGETEKWAVVLKRTYPRRIDRTFGKVFFVTKTKGSTDKTADENDQQRKVELIPHYIYHRDEERTAGEEFKQVEEHNRHEIGLDGQLNFSQSRQFAFTINPNFTDVEADIIRDSINNPFVKQQPEKRRFFLSGFEMYNTAMPVVYTRNIERPSAGVAYTDTGATSSWGSFMVGDEETNVIMPDNLGSDDVELLKSSFSAAFRYNHSLDKKSAGFLGTLRTGEDYHNFVGGIDGIIDLGVDDKVRYQLLYSDTRYPQSFGEDLCETPGCTEVPQPEDCPLGSCDTNPFVLRARNEDLQGHALRINYKHNGPKALYWVNYYDVGADFRADLGFARRTDVRILNFAAGKRWYTKALQDDQGNSRIQLYLIGQHAESSDGEAIEDAVKLFAEFRGSYQTVLRFGPSVGKRAVNRENQNSLELDDNAPRFDEQYWIWFYEISPVPSWTFNLDGRYGDIADAENNLPGSMQELKPKVRYNNDNFEFLVSYIDRNYDVDSGKLYDEQFITLRFNYRSNKRSTHRLIYLQDLTERNLVNWVVSEDPREKEKTLEYTYLYTSDKDWSYLGGIKLIAENDGVTSQEKLAERELYFKLERRFNVKY